MKPLVLPSIAILFASLTLFATAASAADYSDLVKEGLGLMHNDSQEMCIRDRFHTAYVHPNSKTDEVQQNLLDSGLTEVKVLAANFGKTK